MRKVETTPSGSYRVRFRHGLNRAGTGLRQVSETFPTKKEAERFATWLAALGPQGALDLLYAGDQDADVPSLDRVAADHIEHLTGIEEGTRIGYTRLWARTWSPLIGSLPVNEVGRDEVARAVNALAERYGRKSLQNQRGLLSGVLTRAVEKGHLTTNTARGIRLPEGRRVAIDSVDDEDEGEKTFLTHDEWDVLYSAMSPHYQPFIRFLVGTGCRWGEAIVIRRRDIDLNAVDADGRPAPVVKIRRALKWSSDGTRVIGPPKTRKSRRTVVLPPEVVADLRELLDGKADPDLVFTAPRGGMIVHRTFWSKNWRPAIWRAQHCPDHSDAGCRCGTGEPHRCPQHKKSPAACGCPGTLTQTPRIHDLRHTHASWLLALGVPIHVVQARLGHESIQTTVDTYSHLLPDAQQMAASAASMAFSVRKQIGASTGEARQPRARAHGALPRPPQ